MHYRDLTGVTVGDELLNASSKISLRGKTANGVVYGQVIYDLDTPRDFLCLDVNPAFEKITGLSNVVGKRASLLGFVTTDKDALDALGRVARSGKPERFEKYEPSLDAWLRFSVCGPGADRFIASVENITDQKRAHEALLKSYSEIEDLYQHSPCGYHSLDKDGGIVRMNDTELQWLGYTRDEVVGKLRLPDLMTPQSVQTFNDTFPVLMKGGSMRDVEIEFVRKDGTHLIGLINASAIYDEHGKFLKSRSSVVDITRQKEVKDNLQRVNRALRLLSSCNEILIHSKSEQDLLNDICREIVESGGYMMAWVGFPEQDENKTVRPVAGAGNEGDYLRSIKISWADKEEGRGPTGSAIRTGKTQVNQHCLTNPLMKPWREAALKRGYQASIALPLSNEGNMLGALTLYAREPFAFNPEEVALLEELANDLAFGIAGHRAAEAHEQTEKLLRQVEERYRLVMEKSPDAVLIASARGRIIFANPQAERLLGYTNEELRKKGIAEITATKGYGKSKTALRQLRQTGSFRTEIDQIRSDGIRVPVELNVILLPDGNYHVSCRDITKQNQYKARLEFQACIDELTNLPNRNWLVNQLNAEIELAQRSGGKLAVLHVDPDGFKDINDHLGRQFGDVLLKELAKRVLGSIEVQDSVARLTGDEFIVILDEDAASSRAPQVAGKIIHEVNKCFLIDGERAFLTVSVGIAHYPADAEDGTRLLMNAEIAMRKAKTEGKNRIGIYTPELSRATHDDYLLSLDLHDAITKQQFQLHFQPIIDLASGRIVKAEALIRWKHPKRGMVSPARFIPIAERSALIGEIGDWVFREAVSRAKEWTQLCGDTFKISVNMSPLQFRYENQYAEWIEYLKQHDIPGSCVVIELTEGVLVMDHPEVMTALLALRDAGIEVAIDDFGTGYSALSYLNKFHIDYLKIDQSFTRNLAPGSSEMAMSEAITVMAHKLGIKVIAEGIETKAQRDLLAHAGCDFGQGFLYSKAVPAAEFELLLLEQGG